jgi:hypothetical protein
MGHDGQFSCRGGAWDAGLQVVPLSRPGRDDILLYNPVTGSWRLIAAGAQTSVSGTWSPGLSIAIGDLDGDGRTDVFLYDPIMGAWISGLARETGQFEYRSGQWSAGLSLANRR